MGIVLPYSKHEDRLTHTSAHGVGSNMLPRCGAGPALLRISAGGGQEQLCCPYDLMVSSLICLRMNTFLKSLKFTYIIV